MGKVKMVIGKLIYVLQMTVGCLSAGFGVLGIIVSLDQLESIDVGFGVFFIVVGGLLIWRSLVRKNKLIKAQQKLVKGELQAKTMMVIVCNGCAAKNSIPIGEVQQCEYCGTLLEGK